MVKQYKIFKAFLKLIRLPNLVIIAVTQYFMRWYIMKPLLSVAGFDVQLGLLPFAALVLSTVFLAASGYIINDYFDRKIDLVNRPGTVIVGRMISHRYAMFFHIVFTTLGILLGAYVSHSIDKLNLTIVFLFTSVILWFYSTTYKRQLLVGNIIISLLVGIVPMLVLLFEFPLLAKRYKLYILASGIDFKFLIFWISSYSVFAFAINLIREIIKDMEDFEGDFVFGRQTIAIHWGMKVARIVVACLAVLMTLPIAYLLIFHLNDRISLIYISLTIILPLLVIAFAVFWADSKRQYHQLSVMTKIVMLAGILYCPLVNYIISGLR
jgi:4-hydroxybenzoate polyprenyltransferase